MVLPIEIDDRVDGITYRVDDITYDITLMRLKVDNITYRNWWYMMEMWKYIKDDIKQKGRVWVIYGILPGEVMKKSGDHGDITGIYDIIYIYIYLYSIWRDISSWYLEYV